MRPRITPTMLGWTYVLVLSVLTAAPHARGAGPDSPLVGDWQGHWSRAGDTLAVTMHVKPDTLAGRYTASFDSDRLRVSGIPFADVQVKGCCDVSLTLRGDRTTATFTSTVRGDSLTGSFREGEADGRFAFARMNAPAATLEEREITFASGEATLAGSLLLPAKGDSLAAVVFLHGSGAEGRWASRFLATQLARHGIAAFIFDKRGVGKSTGDWRQASLQDLAADGAAAVARVSREPRIDPTRVGIHGHSQGGTLAPLVVARSDRVAFVIGSAAAGIPTDSTEIFSVLNSVLPKARSAADSADARAYVGELVTVAYHGGSRARLDSLVAVSRERPWFFAPPAPDNSYWTFSKAFAKYQPLESWKRVRVPVLLLYGGEDQRVPAAESAARIAAALREAGNTDVTARIFARADHTFRLPPGPSGWPDTAPGYLPALLDWLGATTGSAASASAPAPASPTSGPEPELYGAGLFSTGEWDFFMAFSPDERRVLFCRANDDFSSYQIYETRRDSEGRWSAPKVPRFAGAWSNADPHITRDGRAVFFISNRPGPGETGPQRTMDVWVATLDSKGEWGEARRVAEPVSVSGVDEWSPSAATNGNLYFGSERAGGRGANDLWVARPVAGASFRYEDLANLGDSINTKAGEVEPWIAPDESYLIFSGRGRRDGVGNFDLYISRRENGTWRHAQLIGGAVNTKAMDFNPSVSPDGKWLYFSSTRPHGGSIGERFDHPRKDAAVAGIGNGKGDIYRVPLY